MNTGENVIFSLPVIDAALGLANIRSVICLGNTWTARRYPMTLHRHWPEVEKMLVTVDSFATPRALWHTDPEFCAPHARANGTRSSPTWRRDLSRSGRLRARPVYSVEFEIFFLRAQHSRQRAQRRIELVDAAARPAPALPRSAHGRGSPQRSSTASARCRAGPRRRRRSASASAAAASATDGRISGWSGSRSRQGRSAAMC